MLNQWIYQALKMLCLINPRTAKLSLCPNSMPNTLKLGKFCHQADDAFPSWGQWHLQKRALKALKTARILIDFSVVPIMHLRSYTIRIVQYITRLCTTHLMVCHSCQIACYAALFQQYIRPKSQFAKVTLHMACQIKPLLNCFCYEKLDVSQGWQDQAKFCQLVSHLAALLLKINKTYDRFIQKHTYM